MSTSGDSTFEQDIASSIATDDSDNSNGTVINVADDGNVTGVVDSRFDTFESGYNVISALFLSEIQSRINKGELNPQHLNTYLGLYERLTTEVLLGTVNDKGEFKTRVGNTTSTGNTTSIVNNSEQENNVRSFITKFGIITGHEVRYHYDGRSYYVNHITRVTSWSPPYVEVKIIKGQYINVTKSVLGTHTKEDFMSNSTSIVYFPQSRIVVYTIDGTSYHQLRIQL